MRTVVGVLRGGEGGAYERSLSSGATVLRHLDKEKYDARDIFIDRAGAWHARGVPAEPSRALAGVDIVFNALHGPYAAGAPQRLLAQLSMPYTGANAYESALVDNRYLVRQEAERLGVPLPYGTVVEPTGDLERFAAKLLRSFPMPLLVKPLSGSSPKSVYKADNYYAFVDALARAAGHSPKVLLEEYIPGRRASVGTLSAFRGENSYAFIPVPATFRTEEKEQLVALARRLHEALGPHYLASDFVVGKRGIYLADVEALPELHEDSAFHAGLEAVGASFRNFLDHVLQLARQRI